MNKLSKLHYNRLAVALSLGLGLGLLPMVASAQSLWKPNVSQNMLSDKRAHAVGDIVTILVQHSAIATKDNSTSTAKKTAIDASISSFLYSPTASGALTKNGKLPAISATSANSFDGSGKINNNETLTDKIAVRVIDVLPNGNLVLEGTRMVSFSGESQQAVLRGVVRKDDVTSGNTVYSYNLADASIKFIGKGTVSDNQRKGWATKVWDKITPF
jgi:flagellar L-ring protein precursor FlgH